MFPVSTEEKDFPIAFSILLYKDVDQAERLLRAIYRPSNIYCFHVDSSAEKVVHDSIQAISNCFDNVFVVSKKENVVYAGFSRLQADINCMKDLNTGNKSWKYFINLPSQQFPLKTNFEIVKILKIYNGSNDIEGITEKRRMMRKRYINKTSPPYGVQIVKGSAYGIFSREMVNFILTDKKAKGILEWSKLIPSPDEYYWAILNHNKKLGAPGRYWGDPNKKPWLATYASWVGDLSELVSRKELFANKFYLDYQPYTIDCLEEWLLNKSANNLPFETFYYKQLPFVNNTQRS
ncbi:hypothetical protein KUTeg_003750 [Tegillarca granosa]|uniref:Uncharacterized protein n=1 Tax=Tegillarca granosa TaxID=220873 RepID=A0ABQ9FMZ4_TEGGR|nr:hypothetical protein KUTeg_003750 [Tegillarca granosa]